MRIVNINEKIIGDLRKSGLSREMKSLEFCKFLVIEEDKEQIIGATGIGGFLNVHSLQIAREYHGKGLGKKLFEKLIDEAKYRKYPFILDSINPENIAIVKLVKYFGFKPIFRVHYSREVVREIGILTFTKKGLILERCIRFFNTRIGIITLAIALKIFKSSLFRRLLSYPPEEFPNPNIVHIIKNFEKISHT